MLLQKLDFSYPTVISVGQRSSIKRLSEVDP